MVTTKIQNKIEDLLSLRGQDKEIVVNNKTCSDLFRGFIHYYFNGGGFDHIHDVVDTRSGKIKKLSQIPQKCDDNENGIEDRVRRGLSNWVIAVLDPFDCKTFLIYLVIFSIMLAYFHLLKI